MTEARETEPATPFLIAEEVEGDVVVLGAFQRAASAIRREALVGRGLSLVRRRSGGPTLLAGPGTLHVVLALPRHDAFVACSAAQILNRHVRPLLAGLARVGAKAAYFGRDTVSVAKHPVAWIGVEHAANGATRVEAFVAVERRFDPPAELDGYPTRALDPFLGKTPTTLREALGAAAPTTSALADSIVEAYRSAYDRELPRVAPEQGARLREVVDDRPSWDALVEEAIGFVGAGRDPVEIGGDFFASREVVEALAQALRERPASADAARAAIARARSLGLLEGVRDPDSLVRLMIG